MHAPHLSHLHQAFFRVCDDPCCLIRVDLSGPLATVQVVDTNDAFTDGWLKDPMWTPLLADVARTGNDLRACLYHECLCFEVHVFRLDAGAPAVIGMQLRDVTQERLDVEKLIGVRRISTVGVIVWGAGFGLVDVNEGFLQMTGFAREEALGKTWQDLTPPEFHSATWSAVHDVLTLGEAAPYEKLCYRKDGSRWWGLFAPRRIGTEVVEFVLDVTARKQADAALRDADRRKDEFLATLAHELRNPLAPIKNGMQILRLTSPSGAPTQRTLHVMDRQLDHLIRLVNDLLDVARITSGKVRIVREVISIADTLSPGLDAMQPMIDARRHRLSVAQPPGDVLLEGDRDRLAQVFSNLLSNAVKYTPPGGRIHVETTASDTEVCVAVSDSGVGIAPDQQEQVFDLFSQVRDQQSHSEGGLGVGLALVRSLVRLHGGTVDVHSAGPGQGSTFVVRLPRHAQAVKKGGSLRVDDGVLPANAAMRILVADDNVDAAEMLSALLQSAGHEVVTAFDGSDAVQVAADWRPEVAFLDLGMPGMDGVEAARRLRANPDLAGLRLVALTGWGQAADRQRTCEAGFDLHLVKPLTADGLRSALEMAAKVGVEAG